MNYIEKITGKMEEIREINEEIRVLEDRIEKLRMLRHARQIEVDELRYERRLVVQQREHLYPMEQIDILITIGSKGYLSGTKL